MKPFHIALLVLGAALAGGLAVRMTQPQVFEATHVSAAHLPAPPVQATASASVPAPSPATSPATVPVSVYREEVVYQDRKLKPKAVRQAFVAPPAAPPAAPPKTLPVKMAKAVTPPVPLPLPPPMPYQATPEPASLTVANPPVENLPAAEIVPASAPAPPAPLQVTLKEGIQLAVRLDQTISSDHLSSGDTFQASLAEPLVVEGYIVAERGSHVSGRVSDSRKGSRVSGTSSLELSLLSIQTADGQKVAISTEPWIRQGDSSRNQDVAKIGGGAALGAIIGAIAGGGMGAAIGAGVGGVAGTGAAAATRGKAVNIGSETVIRFRLASRVTITERPL